MKPLSRLLPTILAVLATTVIAHTQERIVVFTGPVVAEFDASVSRFGELRRRSRAAFGAMTDVQPVALSGAWYLAYIENRTLRRFDMRSGAIEDREPVPFAYALGAPFRILEFDARKTGLRLLATLPLGFVRAVAYSPSTDELLVHAAHLYPAPATLTMLGVASSTVRHTFETGVYYVRVKAHNDVGPSPSSTEVRVAVP